MSNPSEEVFFTSEIQNKIPQIIATLPLQDFLEPCFFGPSPQNQDPYCQKVEYFCLEWPELWGNGSEVEYLKRYFPSWIKREGEQEMKFEEIALLLIQRQEDAIVEVHAFGVKGNNVWAVKDWRKLVQSQKSLDLASCVLEQALRCQVTGLFIKLIQVHPASVQVTFEANCRQLSLRLDLSNAPSLPSTVAQLQQQLNTAILEHLLVDLRLPNNKLEGASALSTYFQGLKWEDKVKLVFWAAEKWGLVLHQGTFKSYQKQVYIQQICSLIRQALETESASLSNPNILALVKQIVQQCQDQRIAQLFSRLRSKLN